MISTSLRQHSFMIQYHHNTIKYVITKKPQLISVPIILRKIIHNNNIHTHYEIK